MVTKEKVLEAVNEMPVEFDLDDLFERLIFIDKVEKGLQQAKEGKGIPHEEVKQLVKEWLK